MTFLGTYMRVNCCEVVNPCRVSAYIGRPGSTHRPAPNWVTDPSTCGCCDPTFMAANYTYPGDAGETAGAPWYDATNPASVEFFGAQFDSTTTVVSDDMRTRTISGVIDLVASTERGAWFGFQWLQQALNGGTYPRAGQCATVDLEMAVFCGDDCEAARIIPRARLTGPLTPMPATQPYPCSAGLQVGFVFEAPTPWLYRMGAVSSTDNDWAEAPTMDCRLTGQVAAVPSCLEAALAHTCPPLVLPTVLLPALSTCLCEPMFRTIECVKTGSIPSWTEAAVKITLTTGETEVVGAQIYIWPDDFDMPCPSDPDADIGYWSQVCPVAVANIIVLPANSTMTIDGVTGRVLVECNGCVTQAESVLFGAGGAPWVHPTLSCGLGNTAFCVGVTTDAFQACGAAVDLAVTVEMWEREL